MKLLAPACLKPRGECARAFAAGAIVSAAGYPPAPAVPLNREALYAKACSVRRALRQPSDIEDLPMLARSTGAAPDVCSNRELALVWLDIWLVRTALKINPPRPVA